MVGQNEGRWLVASRNLQQRKTQNLLHKTCNAKREKKTHWPQQMRMATTRRTDALLCVFCKHRIQAIAPTNIPP